MRVLHLPMYSSSANLNGCSSNSIARSLWRYLLEHHPELHVFQTWPGNINLPPGQGGWNYKWVGDEFTRPRHTLVPVTYLEQRYDQTGAALSREWWEHFSPLRGKYPCYDVILNEAPISTPALRKAVSFYNDEKNWTVPIVHKDPYVLNHNEYPFVTEADELAQTLGYATGWNIMTSYWDYELMMEAAQWYVHPTVVKRIAERTIVQPAGTDCDQIDAIMAAPGFKKHDRMTVAMIDRLSAPTNFEFTLAAIDTLFQAGRDFDVQITTLTGKGKKWRNVQEQYAWMEPHFLCPRETYLQLMPRCHALLNLSEKHSYPQGLTEALYAGLVCVLPDRHWVHTVLGERRHDYPFLAKDPREGRAMLAYILDHYEESRAKVAWVRPWMKATYSTQVCAEKIYAFLERAIAENRAEHVTEHWPGIRSILEYSRKRLPKKFSWETLLKAITEYSEIGMDVGEDTGMFSTTHQQVYAEAVRLGWPDTHELPLPAYDFTRRECTPLPEPPKKNRLKVRALGSSGAKF